MLDLTTIQSLYLPSEINQLNDESVKFVNGDKPWQDVSLGKNSRAADAAFFAVMQASQLVAQDAEQLNIR